MKIGRAPRTSAAMIAAMTIAACSAKDDGPKTYTREELLKPETCKECHKEHYTEWSGSMHAYASKDPVFLAMNKRGQRETHNDLGKFCVNCHAPMAVQAGSAAPTQIFASGIGWNGCCHQSEPAGTESWPEAGEGSGLPVSMEEVTPVMDWRASPSLEAHSLSNQLSTLPGTRGSVSGIVYFPMPTRLER